MFGNPIVELPWFSSSGHPHNVSEPVEPPVPNKCRDGLDASSFQHLLVADPFEPLDTQYSPQTPLMKGLDSTILGLRSRPGLTTVKEYREHSSSVDSDLSNKGRKHENRDSQRECDLTRPFCPLENVHIPPGVEPSHFRVGVASAIPGYT